MEETSTSSSADIDKLSNNLEQVDLDEDPTLHAGELIVRLAGNKEPSDFENLKVKSFALLEIDDDIKKAIAEKKGWQVMSKIQQIGLPLALKSPPSNLVAQAQAGTGKTGTFVITSLARMDRSLLGKQKPSSPQAIIIAHSQELVTQIASEVNALGTFLGVTSRRVMSGMNFSQQTTAPSASSAGRGMFANALGTSGGGRGRGQGRGATKGVEDTTATWILKDGEDFSESIVVGTAAKIAEYIRNASNGKKPCIFPDDIKVLVID